MVLILFTDSKICGIGGGLKSIPGIPNLNPQAVVFYQNTKLFNLYVDLRTPNIGKDFTVNDACAPEQIKFLKSLLLQLRTVQNATQRLFSAHGFTWFDYGLIISTNCLDLLALTFCLQF